MQGTEKQAAWAEKIKARQLGEIERLAAHPVMGKRFADAESYEARALAELRAEEDAEVWIRRRHNSGRELLGGAIAGIKCAEANAAKGIQRG